MYTYRYRGHVFNCMDEVNVSPKLKTKKSYAVLSGRCTSGLYRHLRSVPVALAHVSPVWRILSAS